MKRRSFALPAETESKLGEIQNLKGHRTPSEALRWAIDVCYERTLYKTQADLLDELRIRLAKIDAMLRFQLVETVKLHTPQVQASQEYLAKLNKEIGDYVQRVIEESDL